MTVQWNRVTWYSQVVAIVLFVGVFAFGVYVGTRIEKNELMANVSHAAPAQP